MKAERIVLSFTAILVGLIAAGIAFYFYQMTKVVPQEKAKPVAVAPKITPTPTPSQGNILSIETPTDEQVFDKKVIKVSGKTTPQATLIVSTETGDDIITPATNGNFSLSQTIPDGTSILYITAVFPNGEEKRISKTISYSTENF